MVPIPSGEICFVPGSPPSTGRLRRFAKLTQTAGSVAGALASRRIAGLFESEDERALRMRDELIENARKIVATMGELKGAAMKLGQMMSILPENLPEEFRQELALLQTESPSMPYEQIREIIERSLGRSLPEIFLRFDPEPIGAASIGQVHRAKLFDGREVAVKIRYPGIESTLESDLQNLGSLMKLGVVMAEAEKLDAVLTELKAGLLAEADYKKEAENLRHYGAKLEAMGAVVPKVLDELSTEDVLTMSFIDGRKLDGALKEEPEPGRHELALSLTDIFLRMFHEEQFLHADPHPGNFLLTPDRKIAFLDFGCVRTYSPAFTDGWLRILVAKWKGRTDDLPERFDQLGFTRLRGGKGLSADQLSGLLDIVCAPFLEDRDFDWATFKPQKAMEGYFMKNLEIVRFASPPEATFYFRVMGGNFSLFSSAGIRGNFHRPARLMAEKRGLV